MTMFKIAGPRTFVRLEDDNGGVVAYVGSSGGIKDAEARAKMFSMAEEYHLRVTRAQELHDWLLANTSSLEGDLSLQLVYIFGAIAKGGHVELEPDEAVLRLFRAEGHFSGGNTLAPAHWIWSYIRIEGDTYDERCDECGNVIPVVVGGGMHNKHHRDSCSLYDPEQE